MPLKPSRFLDPKTDIVFKKIFGNNPDLLKSFLNGVLPLPDDGLIEDLEYLTPEQTPRIPTMKNTIVDVKCRDQQGRIFIVEMQLHWTDSFKQRLLFGASKAYVQKLWKGEDYESLCPVYGLGIINMVFDHETEEWFHHYRTINVKNSSQVLEGLELMFIELPKFKPQTFLQRKMGVLWLRFLKELDERLTEIPEEFNQSPELSKAMELAQESAYNLAELEAYDKYWDIIRVENSHKKGSFKEGLKEGEKQATFEIAKKMLEAGIDKQIIATVTGITF
mgnify:CR=1